MSNQDDGAAVQVEDALRESAAQRRRTETIVRYQRDALEMATAGAPLSEVLSLLARAAESHSSGKAMVAIHLLDESGTRFQHTAAPSLPPAYTCAVDGMEVATMTGPCCAAVVRQQQIVVADVAASADFPRFADFALPLGIRSGWSSPIVSSKGEVLGTVAHYYRAVSQPVIEDDLLEDLIARTAGIVTERARVDAALRRSEAQLRDANRIKDEFLAMLSHELRTPLNAILGWSQMLRDGTLAPDRQRSALEALHRNARAQAQLVDDLLDVSKIIAGKLQLVTAPVELPAVIGAAVETVGPAAAAKKIPIHVSIDDDVPTVVGDANRLQQIVWNLLSNAVKFTPDGGRVYVDVRASGSSVEIVVRDTGQGIDPAFLPFVFDRFSQADSTVSRTLGGLGLGLAIVRHLAEAHGGTVTAESAGPGHGATFVVSLPVRSESRS